MKALGYSDTEVRDIMRYAMGTLSLEGAPHINRQSLKEKGFTDADIAKIETQLPGVFEIGFAFNRFALGDETMKRLGFTDEQLADQSFNLLKALGFTKDQIDEANEVICGHMTVEGAPLLKSEHLPVFDCASKCGKNGKRYISYEGHIRMMAASQPFISGAISKTINLPSEATVEDVKNAYLLSWKLSIKANALYRDGSKLSQVLSSTSDSKDEKVETKVVEKIVEKIVTKEVARRRKLPDERPALTHKFSVAGHEGYLTVGLFEDGQPGELFIKMNKEGSTLSGVMDTLALSLSLNLQYGVPLDLICEKLAHTRFEPMGMTTNKEIPMVKSMMDYLGRWLALKLKIGLESIKESTLVTKS
jgi:ribonucleoside-diphosphate reductase alpha chain